MTSSGQNNLDTIGKFQMSMMIALLDKLTPDSSMGMNTLEMVQDWLLLL